MIVNFGDRATEDIFYGQHTKVSRTIVPGAQKIARRKLDMIDVVRQISDLKVPPGNRLEKLRGDLAGWWSIRINDQYRIVFRFESGRALDVTITDYH